MLPPPQTSATSTPSCAMRATWRAIDVRATGSRPCPVSGCPRASPESLSRTRFQDTCGDPCSADLEAAEGDQGRALAEGLFEGLTDGALVVMDPGLLGEHDAGEEL